MVKIKLLQSREEIIGETIALEDKAGVTIEGVKRQQMISGKSTKQRIGIYNNGDYSPSLNYLECFDCFYGIGNETITVPLHAIEYIETIHSKETIELYKWFDVTREQAKNEIDKLVKDADAEILKYNTPHKEKFIDFIKEEKARNKATRIFSNFSVLDIFVSQNTWVEKNWKKYLNSDDVSREVDEYLRRAF